MSGCGRQSEAAVAKAATRWWAWTCRSATSLPLNAKLSRSPCQPRLVGGGEDDDRTAAAKNVAATRVATRARAKVTRVEAARRGAETGRRRERRWGDDGRGKRGGGESESGETAAERRETAARETVWRDGGTGERGGAARATVGRRTDGVAEVGEAAAYFIKRRPDVR